jgi:hypothetical protein
MLFLLYFKICQLFVQCNSSKQKLTKVKSHCSQVNVLSKICTQKQNETKFHCQSLYMANTLQKREVTKKKRSAVDDMLKPASHGEPIQHEILQKLSGRSQVPRVWCNHV